jgi:membrane protease YdiL (CAAX protease family)
VFTKLEPRGLIRAGVLSALLFARAHAPYWLLSGTKTGAPLRLALGGIFVYGVVFAALFRGTRSLWASIVYHTLNNLLSSSAG